MVLSLVSFWVCLKRKKKKKKKWGTKYYFMIKIEIGPFCTFLKGARGHKFVIFIARVACRECKEVRILCHLKSKRKKVLFITFIIMQFF